MSRSSRLLAAQLASAEGLAEPTPEPPAPAPPGARLRRLFSRSASTLRSSQTSSSTGTSQGPATPVDSVVDLSLGAPPRLSLELDGDGMRAALLLDLDFGPPLKAAPPPRPLRRPPPVPTPELSPADAADSAETDSYGDATDDEAETPDSTIGRHGSVRRRKGVRPAPSTSAFALTDSEDEDDAGA